MTNGARRWFANFSVLYAVGSNSVSGKLLDCFVQEIVIRAPSTEVLLLNWVKPADSRVFTDRVYK